jgi:hypothetical protein
MGKERWISLGVLAVLPLWSFGKEIKRRVNEEQNYTCARCGHKVEYLQSHHCVPANALKRAGIKGLDVRQNAVGLCSGEWGKGEGSSDDCHEQIDRAAIHDRLFWKDGRLVDLSEIDTSQYINFKGGGMPKRRRKKRRH